MENVNGSDGSLKMFQLEFETRKWVVALYCCG